MLRWSLAIITLLLCLGCNKEDIIKENYHMRKNGVDIVVTAFVKKDTADKENNFSINNLFDENHQTGCLLQAKHGSEIRFDFSKPVFLKNVTLNADSIQLKRRSPSINLANHLSIFAYNDPADIFPAGGTKYNLQYSDKPKVINLDKNFLKVLKVKSLVIEIDNKTEGRPHPALWLSEIQVAFTQKTEFQPTMTLSSIKEKFVKQNASWFFEQKGKLSEDAKNEVLMNIVYYALKGDITAEKTLNNYSPPQADEGEWASFLQSWYESVKKNQ